MVIRRWCEVGKKIDFFSPALISESLMVTQDCFQDIHEVNAQNKYCFCLLLPVCILFIYENPRCLDKCLSLLAVCFFALVLETEKEYIEAAKRNDVETMKLLGRAVNVNAKNVVCYEQDLVVFFLSLCNNHQSINETSQRQKWSRLLLLNVKAAYKLIYLYLNIS